MFIITKIFEILIILQYYKTDNYLYNELFDLIIYYLNLNFIFKFIFKLFYKFYLLIILYF